MRLTKKLDIGRCRSSALGFVFLVEGLTHAMIAGGAGGENEVNFGLSLSGVWVPNSFRIGGGQASAYAAWGRVFGARAFLSSDFS